MPFGEYIPARGLLSRVVNLSQVPADAVPGTGPGLLRSGGNQLGVVISYEVFFLIAPAPRSSPAVKCCCYPPTPRPTPVKTCPPKR